MLLFRSHPSQLRSLLGDGGRHQLLSVRRGEQISERGEDTDETLQCTRRAEPLPGALPFSLRQVRVFDKVGQTLVRSMLDRGVIVRRAAP